VAKLFPEMGAEVDETTFRSGVEDAGILVVGDMELVVGRLTGRVKAGVLNRGISCSTTFVRAYSEAMMCLTCNESYSLLVTAVDLRDHRGYPDSLGIEVVDAALRFGVPSIAVGNLTPPVLIEGYYRRFGRERFRFVLGHEAIDELGPALLDLLGSDGA